MKTWTRILLGCLVLSASCAAPSEEATDLPRTHAAPLRDLGFGTNVQPDENGDAASSVVGLRGTGVFRGVRCTGILITPLLVITAAHCIAGTNRLNGFEETSVMDGRAPAPDLATPTSVPTLRGHLSWQRQRDLSGGDPG